MARVIVELHKDGIDTTLFDDLTIEYRRDGRLHREDGPARVKADGTFEWWLEGVQQEHSPSAVGELRAHSVSR